MRRISKSTADLAPLALSFAILAFTLPTAPNASWMPLVCLPPVLGAVWMQFRLNSALTQLADRSWREQIALTSLPPVEYLSGHIRPREISLVVINAAPVALHLVLLPFYQEGSMNRTPWFMVHLTLALTLTPLTIWGAADQLVRMCEAGPGVHSTAPTVVWSLLLGIAAVGIVAGGAWLNTLLPVAAFHLVFVALVPVIVDLAVFSADRWRDAVRLYGRFE